MTSPVTGIQKVFAAGVEGYALKLLQALGSGLNEEDQGWLIANFKGFPDYLQTTEGRSVVQSVINCYKSYPSRLGAKQK